MKNALVLHGWPQYDISDHFLCNYLRKSGYKVFPPNLFSEDFLLTVENILEEVETQMVKEKPDLIIGISMGGLIVPYFAEKYPVSKLVFISSGPKLEARSKGFNLMISVANLLLRVKMFSFLIKLPDFIFKFFYKLSNPFNGNEDDRGLYEEDAEENISYIKSISLSKEREILNFVLGIDNTDLLVNLENETLIFSGEKDLLMTKGNGVKLHKLLRNSELVVNSGGHFNSFTEKDLLKFDRFIKN
ncbi:hypothetical protein JXA63_04450 [Candidatus Woesebacteria bacterium]|nr:hypothetical protein [Candidatus Woesebacteria bacterium]